MLVMMLGITTNTIAIRYFAESHQQFASAEALSQGLRARLLGQAGLRAGMTALKSAPEDVLYESGFAFNPPDIPVEDCKPKCTISYRIIPEDGKINLNYLVRAFDDEPNTRYRGITERLFAFYNLPVSGVDSLIDWIDENHLTEGDGGEREYYSSLNPVIKIKNDQMYSLSEAGLIKDIKYSDLLSVRAPPDWEKNQEELRFLSEEEKSFITKDDWIPLNNLTAFYSPAKDRDDRINVNAARYHVLMSMSDFMTPEAAKAILKLRNENGTYIKNIQLLKGLPELQIQTSSGITLYDEIIGSGEKTGLLKTQGRYYRVIGIGAIVPRNSSGKYKPVIRKVMALYDKTLDLVIQYTEE